MKMDFIASVPAGILASIGWPSSLYVSYRCSSKILARAGTEFSHFDVSSKYDKRIDGCKT
jgi:hypothetical protein